MERNNLKRSIIKGLPRGGDLLDELNKLITKEKISFGRISGIGATSSAVISYYDQISKKYQSIELKDGMEILGISGNISLREGKHFIHAHIILGNREGRAFGGHLMPGTRIWACEISIDEFDGDPPLRLEDKSTGLYLWETDDK